MQNISVYLNRKAGNGDKNWREQIGYALAKNTILYKNPNSLDELRKELSQDIDKKVDIVFSIGGDGTAHQLIQQLAGTDVNLMVIPGGTANDLAQSLGSSTKIKSITQAIQGNAVKRIDLISVNGTFMATNGGLGFASDVAHELNVLRENFPGLKKLLKIFGKGIYTALTAKKMLGRRGVKIYKFKISSDKFNGIVETPLILVNNQPILGGSFQVAPLTNHQDGTMNVTILKHKNRLKIINCILRVMRGDYPKEDKKFVFFETDRVHIELLDEENSIRFFGDGESFSPAKSWDIRCYPNFLSVYSPKEQADIRALYPEISIS